MQFKGHFEEASFCGLAQMNLHITERKLGPSQGVDIACRGSDNDNVVDIGRAMRRPCVILPYVCLRGICVIFHREILRDLGIPSAHCTLPLHWRPWFFYCNVPR